MTATRLFSLNRPLVGKRPLIQSPRKSGLPFLALAAARIIGGFVLVVAASALLTNAYAGYVPNLRSARRVLAAATRMNNNYGESGVAEDSLHGSVAVVRLPADTTLSMPASNAWVYTPPAYDDSSMTRYPILYLIHGYPGTAADWFVAGETDRTMDVLVAEQLVEPMIVVSMDINGGFQRDTGCLDAVCV